MFGVGFAMFIAQIATEFVYYYPICFASIIVLVCGLALINKIEKFKNKNMNIIEQFKNGAELVHRSRGHKIKFSAMDGQIMIGKDSCSGEYFGFDQREIEKEYSVVGPEMYVNLYRQAGTLRSVIGSIHKAKTGAINSCNATSENFIGTFKLEKV